MPLRGEQNIWAEEIDGVAVKIERMLNVEGSFTYYARPAFRAGWYKKANDLEALRELVRWELRARG